ncbi:hypothetical protein TraAM80_06110 [Trypanosoma rangeli]|uniref:Uncharacterized protein n=1 Tax=Trypanosoma rangeli TaxID=5698 RepID=A0A422NBN3_TRYRA|nr:uncharacterized protein TraAM80_06110 [Trypanosoma rangeli]RNF02907.1 hypothetical protein TraAM80_06110 [Trypanosoma rangeli]|eukprot:RNF02907.1 hypothetical protein TraAM80_06110 [Trypanosoma rangeli]
MEQPMPSGVERFRERNAKLREENAELRVRLSQERPHSATDGIGKGSRELEVDLCRELIQEKDGKATILELHDELTRVKRQCAVYADALEETRGNFVEMKRLYDELNHLLDQCNQAEPP